VGLRGGPGGRSRPDHRLPRPDAPAAPPGPAGIKNETAQPVLAIGADPPHRLHRWRVACELCGCRDRDLHFSLSESGPGPQAAIRVRAYLAARHLAVVLSGLTAVLPACSPASLADRITLHRAMPSVPAARILAMSVGHNHRPSSRGRHKEGAVAMSSTSEQVSGYQRDPPGGRIHDVRSLCSEPLHRGPYGPGRVAADSRRLLELLCRAAWAASCSSRSSRSGPSW
jgi:hypothetical protein